MTIPDVEAPRAGAEGHNLFILCIIGVAALLRFYRLTNQSFWFDEGTTLNLTDSVDLVENARRLFRLSTGGERFQPLYNLIVPYWRDAFGDGEFSLRSFSALAGIGAVALVVLTAYRVFGPAHAAWTGILAASSSFAVYYSQEARPYALLLFLSSAQVFCLAPVLAGWRPEKPSSWWRRPCGGRRDRSVRQYLLLSVLDRACRIAPGHLPDPKAMAPLVAPGGDCCSARLRVLLRRRASH